MPKHCGNCMKEVDFDVTSCPNCGHGFSGMGRGPTADIEERLSGGLLGTLLMVLTAITLFAFLVVLAIAILF